MKETSGGNFMPGNKSGRWIFYLILVVVLVELFWTLGVMGRKKRVERLIADKMNFTIEADGTRIKSEFDGKVARIHVGGRQYDIPFEQERMEKYQDKIRGGMKSGVIKINKKIFNTDLMMEAMAAAVFIDDETPFIFCKKYHPLTKYKKAYGNLFSAHRKKVEKTMVDYFSREGYEYIMKVVGDIPNANARIMEDDYEDWKKNEVEKGSKKVGKADYCRFYDANGKFLAEHQLRLYKQQSPNF